MKTRTKASTKASTVEVVTAKPITQKTQKHPESLNPPQLFILPENTSDDARLVTLENPRYATDSRYLVCPQRGFYEFTKIAAPNITPRSWLLSSQESEPMRHNDKESMEAQSCKDADEIAKGYVTKAANLFIATPVDPIIFLIPALVPPYTSKANEPAKRLFLSGEDYLDRISSKSTEMKYLLRNERIRAMVEGRMKAICDTVEAGEEIMYRVNEDMLLKELLSKASRIVKTGLPATLEDKLVKKVLEVPLLCIKRDESFMHDLEKAEDEARHAESDVSIPSTESADSQTSVSTTVTSVSEASTAATSFSSVSTEVVNKVEVQQLEVNAPEEVVNLLRLRVSLSFICSNYIPPYITATILAKLLSESSPTDFALLENHLASLTKLRQDALAARSLGDMSRKRSILDDDENEFRAEKKRKKEEEEKRKKVGESRGVKNLKKVNTAGMKKMSDFFKKK